MMFFSYGFGEEGYPVIVKLRQLPREFWHTARIVENTEVDHNSGGRLRVVISCKPHKRFIGRNVLEFGWHRLLSNVEKKDRCPKCEAL